MLVGYGTKVGLAPMHTWLPDAHSESPAPISAMLSGALLNCRHAGDRPLSRRRRRSASVGLLARTTLVAFGVVSLLVGALFIVRQNGIKRLMAYSSVEHMGVVALGFGFGGPLGIAGALYHMLNHSLNKSLMFFGAGNVMRSYGSKEIGNIRGVWAQFPVQGALWLAGAVAITGAPPFGLFLSELIILRAGFERGPIDWAVYASWLVLLIVIFIGFLNHFRVDVFRSGRGRQRPLLPSASGAWRRCGSRLCRYLCSACGGRSRSVESSSWQQLKRWRAWRLDAQAKNIASGQLKEAASRLLDQRRADADGCTPGIPSRTESNCAMLASPAASAHSAIWCCDARTIRSKPRRHLAAAELVRARDHRPFRPALSPISRSRSRLVLHEGVDAVDPPFAPDYPAGVDASRGVLQNLGSRIGRRRGRRPTAAVRSGARRRSRIRPSFSSSISAKRSSISARACSSSIAAWRSGSKETPPDRASCSRSASRGSAASRMRLPIARLSKPRRDCIVPAAPVSLRVLLAEMERLYNHLHYFGHLCHTTTLKVGEAEGKLLEERAKQLNARLTGSRFLRSVLDDRRSASRPVSQ